MFSIAEDGTDTDLEPTLGEKNRSCAQNHNVVVRPQIIQIPKNYHPFISLGLGVMTLSIGFQRLLGHSVGCFTSGYAALTPSPSHQA
jgi:hypothetical protein